MLSVALIGFSILGSYALGLATGLNKSGDFN